jgi:hypothetical protein
MYADFTCCSYLCTVHILTVAWGECGADILKNWLVWATYVPYYNTGWLAIRSWLVIGEKFATSKYGSFVNRSMTWGELYTHVNFRNSFWKLFMYAPLFCMNEPSVDQRVSKWPNRELNSKCHFLLCTEHNFGAYENVVLCAAASNGLNVQISHLMFAQVLLQHDIKLVSPLIACAMAGLPKVCYILITHTHS